MRSVEMPLRNDPEENKFHKSPNGLSMEKAQTL